MHSLVQSSPVKDVTSAENNDVAALLAELHVRFGGGGGMGKAYARLHNAYTSRLNIKSGG
jgi:hypothetical protein